LVFLNKGVLSWMLLQPEIPTMLFSLLAFLFLMFFMSRFFLKPVLQLMEKRKNYIQKQLQEAEETNKKAPSLF